MEARIKEQNMNFEVCHSKEDNQIINEQETEC